jgi:hypothetical protein
MLPLPFKAMLVLERARGRKSGGPPLFAPSLKVQGDNTHNNSGFSLFDALNHQSYFPHPCEWRWAQVCSE